MTYEDIFIGCGVLLVIVVGCMAYLAKVTSPSLSDNLLPSDVEAQ